MRLLLMLTFVTFVLAPALPAQKVSSQATVKSQKPFEFVSEEGGFRAGFPAVPQKIVRQVDIGFGKADYTAYQHITPTVLHMIAYFDYPTALTDRTELEILYDQMKELIVQRKPDARVIETRESAYGNYFGRDFVIEVGGFSFTMRCVIIEQRLYQMLISTRGLLSKATETGKKFHQKKAQDFFGSFAVTRLPEPKKVAVELPADFGLKIEDNNFRSDFFKFSMKLPTGWTALERSDSEYIKELGLQITKEETPSEAKEYEFSLRKTELLLMMTKPDGEESAVFLVAAERLSFPNFSPSGVTDNYLRFGLEPDESVVTKTTLNRLGGVDFAWVETLNKKDKFKQRLYVANRGGIAFEITFNYRREADLQILLKALESIRFEETVATQK